MFVMPINSDCISNPLYWIKRFWWTHKGIYLQASESTGLCLDIRHKPGFIGTGKVTSPDSLLECYEYKRIHICARDQMNSKSGVISGGICTWGLICNKKYRVTEVSVHWDCFYPDSSLSDTVYPYINVCLRGRCDSLEYWGILVA